MKALILCPALLVAALLANPVSAQNIRIAVANPSKIFDGMTEKRDAQQELERKITAIKDEDNARKTELNKMKSDRDQLKTDTKQYQDLSLRLMQKAIEYDAWARITQAEATRQQKMMMVQLFNKIVSAVTDVAKKQGIDLVITEQLPEIPENIEQLTPDQLRAIISSRNVLYANADKVDITQAVIAQLNADYTKPQPK
jgi:outer membrane protein